MEYSNVRALRGSERHRLVLRARCRSRSGFVDHVTIADLSCGGCRIDSLGLVFHPGDLVVVRPDGLEGLTGRICWTKHHSAGIAFDRPLHPAVVAHLHSQHAAFRPGEAVAIGEGRVRLAA